jgi:hypothetical protein
MPMCVLLWSQPALDDGASVLPSRGDMALFQALVWPRVSIEAEGRLAVPVPTACGGNNDRAPAVAHVAAAVKERA